MCKSETFVLDAVLKDMIDKSTFNAVLPNGHEIVVFPRHKRLAEACAPMKPGQSVRIEMSPFDMSKGIFVF